MKRLLAALAFLSVIVLAAGCGDPQAVNNTSNATRTFNGLIPNASLGANVNIDVSHGLAGGTGLALGGYTAYIPGPFGDTSVTVKDTATQTVLAGPTTVTQQQSQHNTLIASGIVGGTGLMAPRIFLVTDYPPASGSGTSEFRLVNLSPDAGPLSLFGSATAGGILGQIGLTNVAYGQASPYVAVPTGNFYLALYDATGVAPVLVSSNLNTQGYDVVSNATFTAYVIGLRHPGVGQPPITVVLTPDNNVPLTSPTGTAGQ